MQGSLASMLGAAGTAGAGAFAELLARLELAASDDDKDDYAALVIQRAYRAAVRRRGADAHRAAVREARAVRIQAVYRFVRRGRLLARVFCSVSLPSTSCSRRYRWGCGGAGGRGRRALRVRGSSSFPEEEKCGDG